MAKDTQTPEVIFEAEDLCISAVREDGTDLPIVKDVSFQVHKGEVVALIGESGSGKTTISLSALGYCKPGLTFASGEARLLGRNIAGRSTDELRPARGINVAYLAQSAAATFNPSIRINEQVTEAPVLHGTKTQDEANKKALDLYHALDLPDPETIGERYPHQVSGGQLQRLMAAMALCGDPDLLVLDEPTAGVDIELRQMLWDNVRRLNDDGMTIILTTHYLEEAQQMCDEIAIINHGDLVIRDTTQALLSRMDRKTLIVRPDGAAGDIALPEGVDLDRQADGSLRFSYPHTNVSPGQILDRLRDAGVGIADLRSEEPDLEDVFLSLTRSA